MSKPAAFMALRPDGTVTTIGIADNEAMVDCFNDGQIIVPCSIEQARAHYGQKVDPLNLPA